tara:strand:+ start:391 stop:900 length:510 start_codon:yes stop_codon:yes gene_type:complete
MSLETYFRDSWKPDYDKFNHTGWNLLDKIDKDAHILDIGCGYNLFKPHFKNLYGIDPYNENADEVISLEDYTPHKNFDVYLALGSLNFGTKKTIDKQVKRLYNITKKGDRIIWRQNPGLRDHPWQGVEAVKFFPWNIKHNQNYCNKYNFELTTFMKDTGDRYYVEWIRN